MVTVRQNLDVGDACSVVMQFRHDLGGKEIIVESSTLAKHIRVGDLHEFWLTTGLFALIESFFSKPANRSLK